MFEEVSGPKRGDEQLIYGSFVRMELIISEDKN